MNLKSLECVRNPSGRILTLDDLARGIGLKDRCARTAALGARSAWMEIRKASGSLFDTGRRLAHADGHWQLLDYLNLFSLRMRKAHGEKTRRLKGQGIRLLGD